MNIVTEKICTKCLKLKAIDEFGKSSRSKDGKRSECKECHNKDNQKWSLEHPEERKQSRLLAYQKNPSKSLSRSKLWRDNNPDKWREAQKKSKEKHKKSRREAYRASRNFIIEKYGGKCACCGEKELEFLSIDHVYGGGNKERKTMSYVKLYKTIVKENFPSKYRILCHNCNLALGFFGYCPHDRKVNNDSARRLQMSTWKTYRLLLR